MKYRRMLLAAGAVTALSGLANAQAINWINNHTSAAVDVAFGSGLFPAIGGDNFSGVGDSITRCYTVDQVTGGQQSATGLWTSPAFRVVQGFGPMAATIDIGSVSMRMSTVDDLSGDSCFTPVVSAAQPAVQNNALVAAALIGQPFAPGTLMPFGTVYGIVFTWVTPVTGPNLLGTDSASSFAGTPLISTLVYEVQGPVNENSGNVQYYVASTSETPGLSATSPGGRANGNTQLASALLGGADPITSEAITHSLVTAFNQPAGTMVVGPLAVTTQPVPGAFEWLGSVAYTQPTLHGINNGGDGPGGNDWNVSTDPVSVVDLRVIDTIAGQEANPADPGSNPAILFNQGWFLWSESPAIGTSQEATTWCTYSGAMVNGDPLLGPQIVSRYPETHTVPVCFDPLFVSFLGKTAVSLAKAYTLADSTVAQGGASNIILFQGGFSAFTQGVTDVTGLGAVPLLGAADPLLADKTVGVAQVGLQIDTNIGFQVAPSEFATGLELNFQ